MVSFKLLGQYQLWNGCGREFFRSTYQESRSTHVFEFAQFRNWKKGNFLSMLLGFQIILN